MALDDAGLKALLDGEISNALGYVGKLSEQRRKAIYYYYGEAKEDLSPPEVDGRSSAVSTDLSDVVEWIMPSLMKMFAGGEEVVKFTPRKGSDVEGSKMMTALCNYIWESNDGFKVYHNWFKDALLEKAGVVKIWWDRRQERKREEYEGLTDIQLGMIDAQEGVEIIEHSSRPMPMPQGMPPQLGPDGQPQQAVLHDITVIVTTPKNRICVENVPPEEFLISRRAKSIADAPFICHRTPKTRSDLTAEGYDPKVIDKLSTDEKVGELNAERIERLVKDDETPFSSTAVGAGEDRSQDLFWVAECYLKVDYDGDGIAELRKITKVGSEILDNTEIDAMPFAAITPILMPHRFFGRSIYDILAPIQRIKTAILRGGLDSIYLATNPRFTALENNVNLEDLLASRPGGVVRIKRDGAVQPLTSPPVHEGAFAALGYLDDWRENVSGVTKYNQGTDSNSLNKTAFGVDALLNQSNQRIELIGRVFAETGVKDAFLLIQKLLLQYQKEALAVRINGQFVQVDPMVWSNEYDMSVNVGLGMGNKAQQVQMLQQILALQQQAIQAGLILPKGAMYTAQRLIEAMGFKDTENFLPLPNPQSQDPSDHPMPPQPNPLIQVEQIKQESAQQMAAQKAQSDQQMAALKAQSDQQLAAVEAQKSQAIEAARAQADVQAQQHEANVKYQAEVEKMRMQLALDEVRHSREQETAIRIAQINAEAKIMAAQLMAKQATDTAQIDAAANRDIGG